MKRLLLLGGGPAHRQVLAALARERLASAQVLLVAPSSRSFSAAMLPGFVAGRHGVEQCAIALAPLAEAADARIVEATVQSIDAGQRRVTLADGRVAEYELLSIDDGGGTMDRDAIPGAREHALFLHPGDGFVRLFGGLLDLAARRELDVVVIGTGPAAVELALALQRRLSGDEERARIVLVTGGSALLDGHAEASRTWAARRLAAQRITVVLEACTRIVVGAVHLSNGARLACDAPLIATELRPPPWLATSGLALDGQGHAACESTLQSASHPEVFFAGDDAGDLLAHNLRRYAGGGDLRRQGRRGRPVEWLGADGRHAVVAWGRLVVEGRWVAWWKERRERRALTGRASDAR